MIEDFELLNSVVRSRQFFLRSVKDKRHFFGYASTDIQVSSIILFYGYGLG